MWKSTSYQSPPWASHLALPERRLALANLPTPLEPWSPPGIPEGIDLWIKRDDCTGSTLSGNKARKLEFLLAEALAQGCDTVITCGGIQSNHARATAIAARQLGMDSHLLLNTTEPDSDPGFVGNLLLNRLVGSTIHLITFEQYAQRIELMEELAATLRNGGHKPYVIPEGGSNALGTWGYIEAMQELAEQTNERELAIDDVVFACGSGGTAAGVALGAHLSGLNARVHAVPVCNDATYFHDRINHLFAELGASEKSASLLDMLEGYVGRGYARSTPEELACLREVARTTGILLDPVYTGKAFYGLVSELTRAPDRFQGRSIVFLHTGGLFGLYDKTEELIPLL